MYDTHMSSSREEEIFGKTHPAAYWSSCSLPLLVWGGCCSGLQGSPQGSAVMLMGLPLIYAITF